MPQSSSALIAVLADIHGNTWALDAVLAHARNQGIARVITLGDLVYGPLDPRGALERLLALELPAVHLRGNEDRVLWEREVPDDLHRSLEYTRGQLGEAHLNWLQELPSERALGSLFLCHGAPGNDEEYLLETVTPQGLRPSTLEHLTRRLECVREEVVLCGHSHQPGCVRTASGRLIVNPGAVGLQAYTDGIPHFHVIQTRSPHARYALMTQGESGWTVAHVALPYDWEAAARTAELNGRPDWGRALRSGWI
jgi:putative phosphoesterase